jgi:hypothetical protein
MAIQKLKSHEAMEKVNILKMLEMLTPTERRRAIILQKVHRKYGKAGISYALPLLTEEVIESPDFDEAEFLAKVDSEFGE